jgi:hypothetical protein
VKPLLFALSMVVLTGCSDPPGWMLWSHTYSMTDGMTSSDEWSSYESFFKFEDCKNQIQTEISLSAKREKEGSYQSNDSKITIQQEKNGLKVTEVRQVTNIKQRSSVYSTRFFCMPLGVDPRPKDPSTWILWEYVSVSESGKFIEAQGPYFEKGFLTQIACENEHTLRLLREREWEEKSKDERKNPSPRTSKARFLCRPSGVNVAEEIGVRPR